MKVREIMTGQVQTVGSSTSIMEAARIMADIEVGALPVVDGGRLVGMVTDRDIVLRVVAAGRDPNSTTVRDAASSGDVLTIAPDEDVHTAATRMADAQVRRLPVCDNGEVVGILSLGDVAVEAGYRTAGEAIEGVSEPSGSSQ
jgi:CBS domain-containing protein